MLERRDFITLISVSPAPDRPSCAKQAIDKCFWMGEYTWPEPNVPEVMKVNTTLPFELHFKGVP